MYEHTTSFKQNPTQKFTKYSSIFKKPKKKLKNPKTRSKCMKCMKNERKRDHANEEKITLGRNPSGFEVQREKRMFGKEKESFLSRGNEEK